MRTLCLIKSLTRDDMINWYGCLPGNAFEVSGDLPSLCS